jgi:DNA-binding PadR family transcriptional regulator
MNHEEKKEIRDELRAEKHLLRHSRNWMRHTAMVPKGFLRFRVLETLNEKAMSGSELMEEIQKFTGGVWKPSPGSIYPLLSWLQDDGYIKELPTENGLKRYELTKSGKDLLAEQTKIREKFREDAGFMANPFFDRFFTKIPREKTTQIRASMKRLLVTSMSLAKTLKNKYSEKALDEALSVLDEASSKLQKLNDTLKGESKHE